MKPNPEGYPRISAYLIVDGANAAVEFYQTVFGAKARNRIDMPGGKVGHVELEIGDSLIMLADENTHISAFAPKHFGGSPMALMIYVDDADACFRLAVAKGATSQNPVELKPYGDRSGTFTDPFGHTWYVATRVEEVSTEETLRRLNAQAK